MEKNLILHNLEETLSLGEIVGIVAEKCDVLILTGDLGTGKTTFTKGIARGLGIKQTVQSPTYTIIREYRKARIPLFHIDVYRVDSVDEEFGFEEYFSDNGLSVIEWGNLLKDYLPDNYLEIILEKTSHEEERSIKMKSTGTQGASFLARIIKNIEV